MASTISVDELRRKLEQAEPLTLIDIRPESERTDWWIPDSFHVPKLRPRIVADPELLAKEGVPTDKPLIIVCGQGNSSQSATEELERRGFVAYSLTGGMKRWSLAWNTANVPFDHPTARVTQFRRTGKGCLSYVIEDSGFAAVIDASLDPDVYIDYARGRGLKITSVIETHLHADHLTRGRALAEVSGATYYLPRQKRLQFNYEPLDDRSRIEIGRSELCAIATPGHTKESMSYLLNGDILFSGDTLFVSSVGRPDLKGTPEESQERARLLFESLSKLFTLNGSTIVLPCHTSEPIKFDRRPILTSLDAVIEKLETMTRSEEAFVARTLENLPPTPENHLAIIELNERGELPKTEIYDLEAGGNRCAIG